MKKIKHLLMFLMFLSVALETKAQVSIKNADEIEKVKSGTTFIVLNNLDSASCKEYMEIFKKYWTISKFEFIKYSDIDQHLSPENSFFTIDGYIEFVSNSTLALPFIYLNLWVPDKKYFERKKKKSFQKDDKEIVARIELFPDYATWQSALNTFNYKYDCDLQNHIYNWRPGILKNYLQKLMSELQNPKNGQFYTKAFQDIEKLKELKTQTLYVPDFVRLDYPTMIGKAPGQQDEKVAFRKYPYKYEVVSVDELNNKILDESKPIYYLMFVKVNHEKYISIVNSLTGEVIFSRYHQLSQNFGGGDVNTIYDLIK